MFLCRQFFGGASMSRLLVTLPFPVLRIFTPRAVQMPKDVGVLHFCDELRGFRLMYACKI